MYTPREIAEWLNKEASDEEFLETFALLERGMSGRGIPKNYNRCDLIEFANYDYVCERLKTILNNLTK